MLKLIENGEIFAPSYLGQQSVLLIRDQIAQIGDVDRQALLRSGLEIEVIDAQGCIVIPGLIDPHVHLIGGGGEGGFATRTPEIQLSQLIEGGITTVVGCLGTDGTTRHMTSLLAKARGLEEEGLSTYIYTGNYHVPTPTITSNVKDDVILIDKVIGAGEIAIADSRSAQPTVQELAKLVAESRIGGLLSQKAGVTHFHTGPGTDYLTLLHRLLEQFDIPPSKLYATHINRSEELMKDAISLSHKGGYVDVTAGQQTVEWIQYYYTHHGVPSQLTISSDGNGSLPKFDEAGRLIGLGIARPRTLFEQIRETMLQTDLSYTSILSLVTHNTATVLELKQKGSLEKGKDADVVVLDKHSLDIVHVFARGRHMLDQGQLKVKGTFE